MRASPRSTKNLDRQLGALVAEVASASSREGARQEHDGAPPAGEGDRRARDRATRSMLDGIQIIQRVAALEALVKVLDKP